MDDATSESGKNGEVAAHVAWISDVEEERHYTNYNKIDLKSFKTTVLSKSRRGKELGILLHTYIGIGIIDI